MNRVRVLLMVFLVAFITNLIWENLQAPLYEGYNGFIKHFLICLAASVIDGIVTLAFYLFIGLFRNNGLWLFEMRAMDIFILIILGTITAITFEKWALASNMWAYNENMPKIARIGLTPLIQLPLLSVVSIYLTRYLALKKKKAI